MGFWLKYIHTTSVYIDRWLSRKSYQNFTKQIDLNFIDP